MKAIIINNKLHFQSEFINKNKFNDTVGVKDATDQQWYDWGFRERVVPTISDTEKLGDVFYDSVSDTITYPIINKTQAVIDKELIDKAKSDFKNNLEGVFAYATTPDGTKEYAIKIGNDGKIVTVLIL
jgi:hypothetical protein